MTRNTPEHFETLGTERVRFLLSRQNLDEAFSTPAVEWLSKRDRAEKERQDAVSKSSRLAAWIAAWLALLATIVGFGAWLFPRSSAELSARETRKPSVTRTKPKQQATPDRLKTAAKANI